MATLYIVATPIGNLKDITLRALEILKGVDFILCEDTRVTKRLLNRYNIYTSMISYHQHSRLQKIDYIHSLLKEGKNLALVSDAGTPGISDPGNELIAQLLNYSTSELQIVPICGPSAVTTIASIAGIPMDKFLFLGFPPHKKKRMKFFEQVVLSKIPVIFYESPHRIIKTFRELSSLNTRYEIQDTSLVVGRELTKKFETVYRGRIDEIAAQIEKEGPRGEYVIVVHKALDKSPKI